MAQLESNVWFFLKKSFLQLETPWCWSADWVSKHKNPQSRNLSIGESQKSREKPFIIGRRTNSQLSMRKKPSA